MSVPTTVSPFVLTPNASVTVGMGEDTAAASSFYQRVTGNVFVCYDNVPNVLARNIMQSGDPDSAIRLQLAAYPKRIVAV